MQGSHLELGHKGEECEDEGEVEEGAPAYGSGRAGGLLLRRGQGSWASGESPEREAPGRTTSSAFPPSAALLLQAHRKALDATAEVVLDWALLLSAAYSSREQEPCLPNSASV